MCVNAGRKLTLFHRLKTDPLFGVVNRVWWSFGWRGHLLGGVEVAVATAGSLDGDGLGDTGSAAAVGRLAAGW